MATTVTLKPNAIDISGATSGTTTLQATAVAGTTTLTLPAATDTLVGKATTDTLTNKTLTGAVMNGTLGATTPSTVAATSITASTTLGVTGVATFSAGTAALPAITTTGDTNTGIFFPAADTIAFSEGGAEAMRIDSSGNVGIGTTSPYTKFEVVGGAISVGTGGTASNLGIEILPTQASIPAAQVRGYIATGDSAIGTAGDLLIAPRTNTAASIRFITGTSPTERMRLDSIGNLGLGVTPSAWSSTWKVFQSLGGFVGSNSADGYRFANNSYSDGTNWRYVATGEASAYQQLDGSHAWLNAASGTAGNAITFTQAMTLDASGNLGIGTTSPAYPLDVVGAATGGWTLNMRGRSSDNIGYMRFSSNNGATNYAAIGTPAANTLAIDVNGAERARIDSSGKLLVGTTSVLAGSEILQVRGGIRGDASSVDGNFTIEARSGTIYSNSIYNSTTAVGASVSITGTTGYLQRSTSSIKYKTDVEDMDVAKSESIYQMRPVWYRSKCETDRKDWSYYGLIAEEIAEIEPRLVHWGEVKEDGTQEPEGVMYDRLTVLLLSEMKKQQALITQLQADVAALKGTA